MRDGHMPAIDPVRVSQSLCPTTDVENWCARLKSVDGNIVKIKSSKANSKGSHGCLAHRKASSPRRCVVELSLQGHQLTWSK